MKIADVLKCSFQNWYEKFRTITPKSIVLRVPEGFTEYLVADGVYLPKSCTEDSSNHPNPESDDDSDISWDSDDVTIQAPEFHEFTQKIKDSISELGHKVFPKLNWSSPRDASWIGFNNTCCCTNVADIYLLLKSSDFITHDITQPFLFCEDFDSNVAESPLTPYHLVLREWVEINPNTEFRCFVKNNNLIAITQRDLTIYSDYNVTHQDEIVRDIKSFFKECIEDHFPCHNYIFDVVREKKDEVYLVDFNPFGKVTDSLLFNWEELSSLILEKLECTIPVYRCINKNVGIQPRPLSYYAVPKDIVDISTGIDTDKFVDLMKLRAENQNASSDEEQ